MRYESAIAVARLWASAGGRRELELGALEPLLWRDGQLTVADLVRGLVAESFRVTLTTNGSALRYHAQALKQAGLSLLRISWHTANPQRYKEISGFGEYSNFQAGIRAAVAAGLSISFNRVLLRGCTDDIPDQLEFIQQTDARLKLYDLLWTPELAEHYDAFYQDWRPVIREHVLPITNQIVRERTAIGRHRLSFRLVRGGSVEVKLGDNIPRTAPPCCTCQHKASCLEAFGDYIRVDPELSAHFCYLRRDIAIDFSKALHAGAGNPADLRPALESAVGVRAGAILHSTPLRFILVPYCNYNCQLPGTNITWCHKTTGDYSFPVKQQTPAVVPRSNPGIFSVGASKP